jgi:hypothetical protein
LRSFRLAGAAAEAEKLRLGQLLQRNVRRIIVAVLAAVFFIAALGSAHVAVWFALATHFAPAIAGLILMIIDLLVCLVFALLAWRYPVSRAEMEAQAIRDSAWRGLVSGAGTSVLLGLVSMLMRQRREKRAAEKG